MIKETKILVTGAGGFIGRNLVPLLLENGYEVTALIRPSSDMSSMKKLNIGFLVDPGSAENLTEKLKDGNIGGIIIKSYRCPKIIIAFPTWIIGKLITNPGIFQNNRINKAVCC